MDEIIKSNTGIIRNIDDAQKAASAMAASGFFPDTKTAAQSIVKILAGQELGFGPFASMTGVAIIQGKPAIGANLQAAAIKRTGKYNYRVIEMSDNAVELEFYEAGKAVGRSKFSMTDAVAAGLAGKDNWKKFPRNMLFARAVSNGVKWYAPDIFNGATVYTPDELGASEDADGNIVDAPTLTIYPQPETVAAAHDWQPEESEMPAEADAEAEYIAACEVMTSKGTKYGELDNEKLVFIASPESKATPAHKRQAQIILDHRAATK